MKVWERINEIRISFGIPIMTLDEQVTKLCVRDKICKHELGCLAMCDLYVPPSYSDASPCVSCLMQECAEEEFSPGISVCDLL